MMLRSAPRSNPARRVRQGLAALLLILLALGLPSDTRAAQEGYLAAGPIEELTAHRSLIDAPGLAGTVLVYDAQRKRYAGIYHDGWVERGDERYFFACVLESDRPREGFGPARESIARAVLQAVGALDPAAR